MKNYVTHYLELAAIVHAKNLKEIPIGKDVFVND